MNEITVIAGEDVVMPVKNTEQVKDAGGKINDKISKHFKPGEEFSMDKEDVKHAIKNGVKLTAKNPSDLEGEDTSETETHDINP